MSLEVLALLVVSAVVVLSAAYVIKQRKSSLPAAKKDSIPETADTRLNVEAEKVETEAIEEQATEEAKAKEDAPIKEEVPSQEAESTQEEPKPVVEPTAAQEPEVEPAKAADMNTALAATKKSFWGRIQNLFGGGELADWESIEEVLYTSDLGPRTVQHLMDRLEETLDSSAKSDQEKVRLSIRQEMMNLLEEVQGEDEEQLAGLEYELLDDNDEEIKPIVWMIVGINGSGKTTSIGKLAHVLSSEGKKVMLAAGDTFRAAADAQLAEWSKRAGVELFSPENVKDPSAVAFDACKSAVAKGYDHVIVDTAGRLHTQSNLMEELKKMKRTVDKAIPGAPHEVILVVDGNNGQNALIQAKEFNTAVDLTGVILTKMDGSAKGGVVLGVAHELKLPIKRIGIGEKIEDLRRFDVKEFVDAII
jgi:fused signal recognition particle receptor